MPVRHVLLIGGAGFIGSHLAQRLSAACIRVTVLTRRLERARHLAALPTVELVELKHHDSTALMRLCRGADTVINLVGVLHSRSGEPYGPDFARAHVELPASVGQACRDARVERLIHLSALGAAADAPSEYLRSKAAGETALLEAAGGVPAIILRPSVVFGPGDSFLSLFARLARRLPVLPLARAHARLQPVYVCDVVEVIWRALQAAPQRATWDIAGPRAYSLAELVTYAGELAGRRPRIVPLPDPLAMLQARLMEFLPDPLISRDNVRSLRQDNLVRGEPLPFGLQPTPLEAVAPTYLTAGPRRDFLLSLQRRARRFE